MGSSHPGLTRLFEKGILSGEMAEDRQEKGELASSEKGPRVFSGKTVAEALYTKALLEVSLLPFIPKIVFILVGNDPASLTYVHAKEKKCRDLGLQGETLLLPSEISEGELMTKIHALNRDRSVNGILVQLPLPSHIHKNKILCEIDPMKDVDGLHPENLGRLVYGTPRFAPCTPSGVIEILKFYSVPMEGARAVVIGRSEIVGKPMAQLLLMQNATVTVCHSKTRNLAEETARADILIAALGKPKFVKPEMVKEGAYVIDVGIHRVQEKLCGDVDYAAVAPKVAGITPVPGGVGPMTIAMLMKNLIVAATLQGSREKSPTL